MKRPGGGAAAPKYTNYAAVPSYKPSAHAICNLFPLSRHPTNLLGDTPSKMPRENSFASEGRSPSPTPAEAIIREPEVHSDLPGPIGMDAAAYGGKHSLDPDLLNSQPQDFSTHSSAEVDVLPRTYPTPTDHFRATVRKVIAMNRSTSSTMTGPGIGAEPGVDPRRASANHAYSHIKQKCIIEMVDYSTTRASFGRMTNNEFIQMLRSPAASRRDPWVRVRWINVCGLSWDVISALALKYGAWAYMRFGSQI